MNPQLISYAGRRASLSPRRVVDVCARGCCRCCYGGGGGAGGGRLAIIFAEKNALICTEKGWAGERATDGKTGGPEIGRSGSISIIVEARCRVGRRSVVRLFPVFAVMRPRRRRRRQHELSGVPISQHNEPNGRTAGRVSWPLRPHSCREIVSLFGDDNARRDETKSDERRVTWSSSSQLSARRIGNASAASSAWKSFSARGQHSLLPAATAS